MSTPPAHMNSAVQRLPTGVAGLDTILNGGLMVGGIYIIQGNPGAGKTILTNQICFHHISQVDRGNALFVTLLSENHARMISSLCSLSFFDEHCIPDRLRYVSGFNELRKGGTEAVGSLLRREILSSRCSLLVIDGIVSAQTTGTSEQAFKEFIHGLQEVALATDCTIIMTSNSGVRTVTPEDTMVDGLIRLNDQNYGWRSQSDLQVTKFRGGAFMRGRHAYEVTSAGVVVHPRIEALLARPSQKEASNEGKASSGIRRLDEMLEGGVPTGSTTVVMGPSGAGKTTVGLHFLSESSDSEPGLMFGFYETPARIRAKAEVLSQPLAALIDAGTVEILWQPPTDDLLDAYGERLLEAVRQRGVRRLFIDGLGGFTKAAVEPTRMEHFFTTLANELRVLGVTTLYTLEVPDILGPAVRVPVEAISSIAENMVLLRFVEVRSRLYRLISILKVRNSSFDPSLHEYTITNSGLIINETPDSAEAILSTPSPSLEGQTLSPADFHAKGRD
jgi:circadian clock protein KaiC